MVEVREILCPTDFSDASRHALEHAIVVAKWYGSRLTGLHVAHVPLFPQPPILGVGFAELTPAESNPRFREDELRAWLAPAQRVGLEIEACVDEGNPALTILEYARARQTDLIVMGTHGLGGFERLMLGSVTEKVLRRATCAVMTVPAAMETTTAAPYERLLCPVDFSESSLAALRLAVSLAEEADARLTILHVFDWPADDELLIERLDAPAFRRVVETPARDRLEAMVTDDMRVWCKPSTKVAYGKPYRGILETAAADNADLIVMGVRGRNPLDLTLFGSTTNQVVRRASCPVLTLKQ